MISVKNLLLFMLVTTSLSNAQSNSMESRDCLLIGKITGLPSGINIFLVRNKQAGGTDTIATTKSTENKFLLKGILPYQGEIYFVKFANIKSWRQNPKTKDTYIKIALESQKSIILDGDIHDLSKSGITVTGSVTHQEYIDFTTRDEEIVHRVNKAGQESLLLYRQKKIDQDSFYKEQKRVTDPLVEERSRMVASWIEAHPNSYFTPWIIMKFSSDIPTMESCFKKLSKASQQGAYGVQLNQMINKTDLNQQAVDFKLATATGDYISLYKVASKNRYVLIDFWASWCGPCRKSVPKMKKLYTTYKDKGLQIIGYSIDKKADEWEKALVEDKLPWPNVREMDPKFSSNNNYNVRAVPTYFIVDSKGKIVFKDLGGAQLESKLRDLMGE